MDLHSQATRCGPVNGICELRRELFECRTKRDRDVWRRRYQIGGQRIVCGRARREIERNRNSQNVSALRGSGKQSELSRRARPRNRNSLRNSRLIRHSHNAHYTPCFALQLASHLCLPCCHVRHDARVHKRSRMYGARARRERESITRTGAGRGER